MGGGGGGAVFFSLVSFAEERDIPGTKLSGTFLTVLKRSAAGAPPFPAVPAAPGRPGRPFRSGRVGLAGAAEFEAAGESAFLGGISLDFDWKGSTATEKGL